ncbi:exo-alpha-sialidase [Azoarcus sp. L1K30]|uniref:sialidase family protein n=1 Tax=Azoarcus sp. L1K30 TaxID=2820277 RepID=UPI001B822C47|nr:sialidase family protein [Azoarcus sp. L1K30]MBR0567109.1 exo-alpha-sialidase [Azoarcus sp. L1K30]
MKWIRRVVLLVMGVVLIAVFLAAMPGIPRKDVLECGLPDGSKFVLTAGYDWYPLARVLPEAAERLNQGPWSVEYQEEREPFKAFKSEAPASVSFLNTTDIELREVCAKVGKLHGIPLVAFSYLNRDDNWLPLEGFPWEKLTIGPWDKLAPSTRGAMQAADFKSSTYLFSLVVPSKDRYIYEQPLLRDATDRRFGTFEGVYQSISTDGGKTWSKPVITTKAIIFEMGKSWLDQCFVARPIRINGRQIKPDFPAPCPDRSK